MLLFFIIFMFFILHIQFLVRNVVFGTYDTSYFQFTSVYVFDHNIAVTSLIFSGAAALCFGASYRLAYRQTVAPVLLDSSDGLVLQSNLALMRAVFVTVGALQAMANIVLAVTSDFTYQTMAETLESSGFIFELRVFALAALAFVVLNVRPAVFWRDREYRLVRIILLIYAMSVLIVQARSRIFEFSAILVYAYLMWSGDKVRWRYLGAIILALLIPNLIVLGRLGIPDDPALLIDGLFSFEYSITLNNFLGAAIERSYAFQGGLTFLNSLWLLIPSPIRSLMDIDVVKNDAYEALAAIAQVRNGGYSMLAEMYQNFGWFGLAAFVAMGFGIGRLNRLASRVGQVSIVAAVAPLIYTAFVIAFRNDFGVFIKFVVQAILVAYLLQMLMVSRARRMSSATIPAPSSAATAEFESRR